MNNHNDMTTREMRSEIGVSNFSFTLFRVHSVLIGCWTTVYEPVKALFDTTPQLSKEEFEKAINEKENTHTASSYSSPSCEDGSCAA